MDPFAHGTPVGDHHTWVAPEPESCPDCDCCSARLCQNATTSTDPFKDACHFIGASDLYDLSMCPCWRNQPGGTPLAPTDQPRGTLLSRWRRCAGPCGRIVPAGYHHDC